MKIQLKENEMAIGASDSYFSTEEKNHKGKFVVTNQRIYFFFDSLEHNPENMEIIPDEIKEVIYFKDGLFSKPGLQILVHNGESYRFLVKNRDKLGKLINKMY